MIIGPLIVVGMHRSGTSCLAGLLEEAGVWLGEIKRRSDHNPKGNRENPDIMRLNDAVLHGVGAAWNAPPDGALTWDDRLGAERDRILAGYPVGRIWGFKDPRTLFTLPFWRAALPEAQLVGSLRHPVAVALSLQARNRMPVREGLALWTAYNRRLCALAQAEDVPILSFDAQPAAYRVSALYLVRSLGLTPPSDGLGFYEEDLRHQGADHADVALPADTAALYEELQERVIA